MNSESRGFSGSTIKLIAMAAMFIDHIGAVILQRMLTAQGYLDVVNAQDAALMNAWAQEHQVLFYSYTIMRLIGRMAFPLFAFLLVEGFQKTSDLRKYMLRLAAFALISEIPFDLAVSGKVFAFGYQNVFFTLLLGLVFLQVYRKMMRQGKMGFRGIIIIVIFMLLAELLRIDYGSVGILIILIFYLLRMERVKAGAFGCAILGISSIDGIFSFTALYPIAKYNGERGLKLKYAFYAFYPVHLLMLYLVAVILKLA